MVFTLDQLPSACDGESHRIYRKCHDPQALLGACLTAEAYRPTPSAITPPRNLAAGFRKGVLDARPQCWS
jgi:hypothetical protein